MLTDRKDAKGWPSLFAEGTLAYAGLQRAFEWIEGPAGPAAGRGLYADFLDEVSGPLGRKALKEAATAFRESGRLWSEAAGVIAACGDKAIREGCEIAERRFELSDVHGEGVSAASAELWQKRHAIGESCRLSKEKALAVFGQLAPLVGGILAAERSASELLSA
jgi:hypothetical protein